MSLDIAAGDSGLSSDLGRTWTREGQLASVTY
jgi:hypothetical protein